MADRPCKNCPKRYPGCSDHCTVPDYQAWRAKQDAIKAARKKYVCPIWTHGEKKRG